MIDKRDVRIVEAVLSNTVNDCSPYLIMIHATAAICPRSGSWCAGFWDGLFGNALDSSLSRPANDYMRGHAAGAFAREIYVGWA